MSNELEVLCKENGLPDLSKNIEMLLTYILFPNIALSFFKELDISLQIALPTTNPSAFFRDLIVFSVIPNPITTFFALFWFLNDFFIPFFRILNLSL